MKIKITVEQIEAVKAKLSKPHAAILHAAIAEEGDYNKIAASLGLKLNTVKTRLHRARKSFLKNQEITT